MLAEIGNVDRIPEYIKRSKDKNDSFRLMGFGHRVYKNYDPRAKIMQKTAHEVLNELGIKDDPLLDVAMELERIALTDEYFIEKKLYPNVDFYSGITLKAMGFPTTMFTVLFAVARTVGWIAQWKEMIEDPSQKIGRPRQLYTGATRREYQRSQEGSNFSRHPRGPHQSAAPTETATAAFPFYVWVRLHHTKRVVLPTKKTFPPRSLARTLLFAYIPTQVYPPPPPPNTPPPPPSPRGSSSSLPWGSRLPTASQGWGRTPVN